MMDASILLGCGVGAGNGCSRVAVMRRMKMMRVERLRCIVCG